jgi:arsenite methyltransferase
VGIDLDRANVEHAQQRLKSMPLACPVELQQASLLEPLAFPDNSFDLVWCANVIQYFDREQLGPVLAEFRRVLRPGGKLAIKEFDSTALMIQPFDPILVWHLFEAIRGTSLMQGSGSLLTLEFKSLLVAAGFKQVHHQSFATDLQQPLSAQQRQFSAEALAYFAKVAEQASISPQEKLLWRRHLADPSNPLYLLNSPGFLWREVAGLATGLADKP